MHIQIFEAGKSRGNRAVDVQLEVQHATLRIGGAAGLEVTVPGLAEAGHLAEIRVAAGLAEMRNVSGDVKVAGRPLAKGQTISLGPELLLTVDGKDLVYRSQHSDGGIVINETTGQATGRASAGDSPSVAASDLLQEVYAALGVPDQNPAVVVYDADGRVVKRVDLVPPRERCTVGRHPDSNVVLYQQGVSKNHLEVRRDGLGFLAEDLGSRNGTLLNGSPLRGKQRIKSGDRLQVASFIIRFVDPKATGDLASSVPDLDRLTNARAGHVHVRVGQGGPVEHTVPMNATTDPLGDIAALDAEEGSGGGGGGKLGLLIAGVVVASVAVLGGLIYVIVQAL
ncbi:MAG: FHA domain-containing protein [Planctomycetota bacterium]|jgi:pSer/pThr/pTyr-binding forkhead associated (FHA) protein